MRYYIIASHDKMAYGLKSTLDFMTGGAHNIRHISAYTNGETDIDKQIQLAFEGIRAEDEVVVMTDILNGSVNQKLYPFIRKNVYLFTGVNLPFALEILLYPANQPMTKQAICEMVEKGRSQLIYVNGAAKEIDENNRMADDE